VALATLLVSAVGHSQTPPVPSVDAPSVSDQILVRFAQGTTEAEAGDRAAQIGAQVVKRLEGVDGLYLIRLPPGLGVPQARAAFVQAAGVLYAEPNYLLYSTATTPNDPQFPDLWGMHNTGQSGGTPGADIHAPEAWDLTTGSSAVVVAVIDSGIDYLHADLAANMFRNEPDCNANGVDEDGNGYIDDCYGIDTANDDTNPMDDNSHGTHVSGTIGAAGNNGIGVVGVNWNVKLMACKFLGANGNGNVSDAIDCLQYVRIMKDRGVNIVATNNSWGGGGYSQALYDAIDAQRQGGILFIAAAGNASQDTDAVVNYPSGYDLPNVVSVASTTRTDGLSSFSNFGRHTADLGAPGSEIWSTTPGNTYGIKSGTSMATPHVTGVAALLKAQDPGRDWRAIRNLILAGGDGIASLARTVTGRRLNAYGSLTCANVIVQSRLAPELNSINGSPGQAITLRAVHINCANPAGDVTVTVSNGNPSITLRDDGVAPDQGAEDGVYSGTFTPVAGSYTLTFPGSDTVTVDVANATYDSSLMTPRCTASASFCSSGVLLNGRDTLAGGAEPHQPNTIKGSCADGTFGTYLADESIETIKVSSVDGSPMRSGNTVRVDVTVFAYDANDHLDIYTSPSAATPAWGYLTTLTPTSPGLQTLSTTFALGTGGAQAIRAHFRFLGSPSPCSTTNGFDDHDDLVYQTGVPFTDDLLSAGSYIRAIHITELRMRVNAVRAANGLAPFDFTDATVSPGLTIIRASHIIELRSALVQVYAVLGRTPPAYTDPGLGPGYPVKAVHITELRDAVINLE
jgi:subtilisin family serine protease